jgi:SAM-dependent methyltransferase
MQFDQFAADYKQVLDRSIAVSGEDSAYFAEYKARYLARVFAGRFPRKALDFGCGVGLLSGFLKRHLQPARLDGFDVSPESIGRVHAALVGQGTFTSDRGQLARDYNLIVVANVMHHIPPDQRLSTVRELASRLAVGGRLAIFEHNPANPVTRRTVDRCPFDEDAILLTPEETVSYLAQVCLTLVRRDYIVFMPRILAWFRPLEPWLAWLPLGAQYVVLGQRSA